MRTAFFDLLGIVALSLLFAFVFMYLIPVSIGMVGYDEGKMQNAARANAYDQYLERKGIK